MHIDIYENSNPDSSDNNDWKVDMQLKNTSFRYWKTVTEIF